MHTRLFGAAAAVLMFVGGGAGAATLHFTASLQGSAEVPPNTSNGTGQLTATLNTATRAFAYKVTYSGLSGPPTMAHFHGPAEPGHNAPPEVPVPKTALASPITGDAKLTPKQVSQLDAGKWYFNIHTAAHPGGEVRGQVTETK